MQIFLAKSCIYYTLTTRNNEISDTSIVTILNIVITDIIIVIISKIITKCIY